MIEMLCPKCGGELEIPDSVVVGQHLLCPYCNEKFSMPDVESDRKSVITEKTKEQIESEHNVHIYLEMDKLRRSKDLNKFYRLFKISPLSVKVASALIFLEILICSTIITTLSGANTGSLATAALYIWILCGILKGSKGWRTALLVVKIISLICGISLCFNDAALIYYYNGIVGIFGFVIAIPYLVLLFVRSSNDWFNGVVKNVDELHRAVDADMKPTPVWKAIAIGVVFLLVLSALSIVASALLVDKPVSVKSSSKVQNENDQKLLAAYEIFNEYNDRIGTSNLKTILENQDLLYGKTDVENTRKTLMESKQFLLSLITKSRDAKSIGKHKSSNAADDLLQAMTDWLYSQYCTVQQAEVIFYSELFYRKQGTDDDKKYYKRYYGEIHPPSESEIIRFTNFKAELFKYSNTLKTKLNAL